MAPWWTRCPAIHTRRRARSSPIRRLPCVHGRPDIPPYHRKPVRAALRHMRRRGLLLALAGLRRRRRGGRPRRRRDHATAATGRHHREPPAARPDHRERSPAAGRDRARHVPRGRSRAARATRCRRESLALLTGRGGRITPRVVRVPAFISIRVELRSADGAPYVLRFGRRTLAVRAELPSVSHRFDGLRPGRRAGRASPPREPGTRCASRPPPSPVRSHAAAAGLWLASQLTLGCATTRRARGGESRDRPRHAADRARGLPGHQRPRPLRSPPTAARCTCSATTSSTTSGSASSGPPRTSTSPRTASTGTSASPPRSASSACTASARSSSASRRWPRSSAR